MTDTIDIVTANQEEPAESIKFETSCGALAVGVACSICSTRGLSGKRWNWLV